MTESNQAPSDKSRSWPAAFALTLNAVLISLAWLHFVSHGFTADGIMDAIYEMQANSFGHGQVSIVPGPLRLFVHDVVMHSGEYYFYQGFLPSILFLAVSAAMGRLAAHYILVFLFFFSLTYFYQRIVGDILDSAAPDKSKGKSYRVAASMLLTCTCIFVIPYPLTAGWFFARFAVYEQQILFGLAVIMPALYFLITGVKEKSTRRIAVTGVLFSLAAWTRVTWLPLALVFLPVSLFFLWRWSAERKPGMVAMRGFLMVWPSLIMLWGLFCLNYFRFGSFFDFGRELVNTEIYIYLRNVTGPFSSVTKLWNIVFNFMSYYASPGVIKQLDLSRHAYSVWEAFPPSFFYFNPQFLPMLLVVPVGLYVAWKSRRRMPAPIAILAIATLYINGVVVFFGVSTVLRFFVEFYYLMILTFLAALLVFLRPGYGAPIFILLLAFHIPDAVVGFSTIRPELRTVNAGAGFRITSPPGRTFFLNRNVIWPREKFSAEFAPHLARYNAIGIKPGTGGLLLAKDVFAVYMIPGGVSEAGSDAVLRIRGLTPVGGERTARIYFENRFIGSIKLNPGKSVDATFGIPRAISRVGPYRILGLFLPGDSKYLPPRTSGEPVAALREIQLDSAAH